MTTTSEQAVNEMYGAVKAALVVLYPAVERRYDGKDSHEPPDTQTSWIYADVRHADGGQGALAGADGTRRWNRNGTIIVQCFVPVNKQGREVASAIAATLRDYFQSLQTESGVWFTNATFREVGVSDGWYQVNFSSTFSYDTFS
jgi:hypothetical protein